MLGDEKEGLKLLLDYRICQLYVESNYSVSGLCEVTGVSLPKVKRALHVIENSRDECLRLLPDAQEKAMNEGYIDKITPVTKTSLDVLEEAIKSKIDDNRSTNRWGHYTDSKKKFYLNDVKRLAKLFQSKITVNESMIEEIRKARMAGTSCGKIAESLGISKSTVSKYDPIKGTK